MPAIDIARLKIQTAVLVENFDQPAVFIPELHKILDLYADRTMRKGIVRTQISVLPAYQAPASVLRQIEMEVGVLTSIFTDQALNLADYLWKDGYLESRLLAAALLGRIKPETPTLISRISEWVSVSKDEQLVKALLGTSLKRVRRETPDEFLKLIHSWLDLDSPKSWGHAIHAIIPLLADPDFQNLPPIFDSLSPVVKILPPAMQNDLADLINALYTASPVETTYFLRQVIAGADSPQITQTMRRVMTQLPASLRPVVLEMVRQRTGR